MLLEINSSNPNPRKIKQVIDVLEKGGIIIYPSDSVYALACDIHKPKAIDKICHIRKLNPVKANLTFVCESISQVSSYTKQLNNDVFRLIKQNTPGPVTFILNSNNDVPKAFKNKKRTIGVRIPANEITKAIINQLGRPILSISLKNDDEILEYFTDPYEIHNDYEKLVDIVIDGGAGGNVPSAILNCASNEIELIREGVVEVNW